MKILGNGEKPVSFGWAANGRISRAVIQPNTNRVEGTGHSTVPWRLGKLKVALPVVLKHKAAHVVVDSTGVKVYGKGEWKTCQYRVSKRRKERKLHLRVDEETGEILASVVTTNDYHDSEVLPDILDGIPEDIEHVSGDGLISGCAESITHLKVKIYQNWALLNKGRNY